MTAQGVLLGVGLKNLHCRLQICAQRFLEAPLLIDGKGVDRIIDAVEALL